MVWTAQTTPWDGASPAFAYKGCFAAGVGAGAVRLAVTGSDAVTPGKILTSDDAGGTWIDRGQIIASTSAIAYAVAMGKYILAGLDGSSQPAISLSADAATWGSLLNPFGAAGITSLATNTAGDLAVAVDVAGGIWTTTNGTAWTARTSPFSSTITQVKWIDEISEWWAVGQGASGTEVSASSPDGITWTTIATTPFTNGSAVAVGYHALTSQLYLAGYDISSNFLVARTGDTGSTWTTDTTPFDGFGYIYNFADTGTTILAAGYTADTNNVAATSPGDGIWTTQTTPLDGAAGGFAFDCFTVAPIANTFIVGEAPFSAVLIAVAASGGPTAPAAPTLDSATPAIDAVILAWTPGPDGGSAITGYDALRSTVSGGETLLIALGVTTSYIDQAVTPGVTYFYEITAINAIGESGRSNELSATPFPPVQRRWSNGTRGRIIVTDLLGQVTTWLDNAHLGAQIPLNLNQPSTITIALRSNSAAVNTLYTDGDPLVAQSNRLVYVLLRDGNAPSPWQCRAAGICMSPQDQADAAVATTHLVAYDPWQYVNGRPFYSNNSGDLPGPKGFLFPATRGGVIIGTAIKNATEYEVAGTFIDAGPAYGGTIYWNGVIEDTPILDYNVQQGQSIADVWAGVIAGGDPSGGPGGADIILTPIYDPVNRPGYTHELSVYNLAGTVVPSSPMAWGEFTRVSTTADRQHDGTPGAFINQAYYYAGQGGFPVGLIDNAVSVAKYRPYRATQFFPQQPESDIVTAFAHQALTLGKQGRRTFTVDPDPMRAPPPFTGYNLGDRIPQLAPKSLRVEASGYQRIQTIPLEINQDGVTRVRALLTTPDWRGDDGT